MHIHIMRSLQNTCYVFDIDVEAHQNGNGSIASTTAHGDRILGKIPEQNNLEN